MEEMQLYSLQGTALGSDEPVRQYMHRCFNLRLAELL